MLIYSGGIYASLLQKKFWKAMTGFIPRGIAVCIETGMKSMYGIKIFQPVDIRIGKRYSESRHLAVSMNGEDIVVVGFPIS